MDEGVPTECKLDLRGLRRQRDRYGMLGAEADEVVREPGRLAVRFRPGFDEALLRETIAVERECCPFFRFDYLESKRSLEIGVSMVDQDAALDGLAYALGGAAQPGVERSAASPSTPRPPSIS